MHTVGGGGRLFADLAINFGARSSPFVFQSAMMVVTWILQRKLDNHPEIDGGNAEARQFLDDLGVVCRNQRMGDIAFQVALALYERLRMPLSIAEKQLSPRPAGEYLGYWIDLRRQLIELPKEKREAYATGVAGLLSEGRAESKALEKLAGRLGFASEIHRPARCYSRSIYALSTKASRLGPGVRLELSERAREDLRI